MKPTDAENAAPTRKNTARPDADAGPAAVGDGQQEQQEEDDDGEDAERAELPVQVGRRAFLHRLRDLLHLRRALVGARGPPRTR